MTTLTPYLTFKNSEAAIAFYEEAFGASQPGPPLRDPRGFIPHAEIAIGDAVVMMADEDPAWGNVTPENLGGTPVRLALQVDDVDAFVARAEKAGAKVLIPVADQFYGHRAGRIEDPFGYIWIVSTQIEELSHEQMQARMAKLFGGDA